MKKAHSKSEYRRRTALGEIVLPPETDRLTPEERAVIEAAKAWRVWWLSEAGLEKYDAEAGLHDAIEALGEVEGE